MKIDVDVVKRELLFPKLQNVHISKSSPFYGVKKKYCETINLLYELFSLDYRGGYNQHITNAVVYTATSLMSYISSLFAYYYKKKREYKEDITYLVVINQLMSTIIGFHGSYNWRNNLSREEENLFSLGLMSIDDLVLPFVPHKFKWDKRFREGIHVIDDDIPLEDVLKEYKITYFVDSKF